MEHFVSNFTELWCYEYTAGDVEGLKDFLTTIAYHADYVGQLSSGAGVVVFRDAEAAQIVPIGTVFAFHPSEKKLMFTTRDTLNMFMHKSVENFEWIPVDGQNSVS